MIHTKIIDLVKEAIELDSEQEGRLKDFLKYVPEYNYESVIDLAYDDPEEFLDILAKHEITIDDNYNYEQE